MRRSLAILTLSASVLMSAPPPAHAIYGIPGAGDLLFPGESINGNIDRLEAALRRLIEQIGKTVDEQTLKAMQRLLLVIESARGAYGDALTQTMEEVGSQRAALLYDLHNQMLEAAKVANQTTNELAKAEQRTSNTLLSVLRAPRVPLLLDASPQLYRPDLADRLPIDLQGQHLNHPDNRLIVGTNEYAPAYSYSNTAGFLLDRSQLVANADGVVPLQLRMHQDDTSFWRWLPGHKPPKPTVFNLTLKPLGQTVGTYAVQSEFPSGKDPYFFDELKQGPDYKQWSVNPGNEEVCADAKPGTQFDPAHIDFIKPTTNEIYTPAQMYSVVEFEGDADGMGGRPVTRLYTSPAKTEGGPDPYAELTLRTPEKICLRALSPVNEPRRHTLVTSLRVRMKYLRPEPEIFATKGTIPWGRDTDVGLPRGYRGFKLTVDFINGESRVFNSATTFGPLEIKFDPNSRTLVMRPQF